MKLSEVSGGGTSGALKLSDVMKPKEPERQYIDVQPGLGLEGDPNLSGHDLGQMLRGGVADILGIPGAVEKLGRFAIRDVASQDTFLPTPSEVETKLFGKPADERDKGYRAVGSLVGSAVTPALIKAPAAAARVASGVGNLASKFAPPLASVGEATTISRLGDVIRKSATDSLGKLNEGQAAQIERALESHGIDIYEDKAATLPARIFRDRDTVALLKRLAGDDPWLENQAGVYAATRLKEITAGTGPFQTHASRAAGWAARNNDWLNEEEFPKVKAAVDSYIAGLRRMAVAKGAGAAGAATAATSIGIPMWLRHIGDLLP